MKLSMNQKLSNHQQGRHCDYGQSSLISLVKEREGFSMNYVEGKYVIYSFRPDMPAVLTVDDGAIVVFDSNDCFFQQIQTNDDVLDQIDHDRLNPATGPVFVKGAKPGDLLRVDIMAIDDAYQGIAADV